MSRPTHIEMEELMAFAHGFDFSDVAEYMRSVEQADWMTEIMDDPESEMFSSADMVRINEILLRAFESAHSKSLADVTFRDLLFN